MDVWMIITGAVMILLNQQTIKQAYSWVEIQPHDDVSWSSTRSNLLSYQQGDDSTNPYKDKIARKWDCWGWYGFH